MSNTEPPVFKLTLDRAGNPDFSKMKENLADSLKTTIFGALPTEYFDAQVQVVFDAMTKPRMNVKATGDARCKACRGEGYPHRPSAQCPHVTGPGPSEIDEMIYNAFRERFKAMVESIAERWADKNFDDQKILDRVEQLIDKAAQSYLSAMGNAITKNIMERMGEELTNVDNVLGGLLAMNCMQCGAGTRKGTNCTNCSTWNA